MLAIACAVKVITAKVRHNKIMSLKILNNYDVYVVGCSRGYSKCPIIDPATVQLQNNCTVSGNYTRRLLYSGKNRCTIIDLTFVLTRKMVPITGRARSFLLFLELSKTK